MNIAESMGERMGRMLPISQKMKAMTTRGRTVALTQQKMSPREEGLRDLPAQAKL
jgi:hypothetical protein